MGGTSDTRAGFQAYAARLAAALQAADLESIGRLAHALRRAWAAGANVFLCGNGGSAGNAVHLANDFVYGIAPEPGRGLRAHALPANVALVTCLANDTGYDNIFAGQLRVLGNAGDVLIAFSGSGNSPNILRALETARAMEIESFAVLGYSGGKARSLADTAIHFPVDDMQVAEDLQLTVGHMAMQWLRANPLA
jgi:D-sedoheptulose 7-phosphate isomerase